MEARRWRITLVALVLGSMVLPTSGVALAPVALAHHQEGHDAQSEQATERSSAPDQQDKEKPSATESPSETVEEPATEEEPTTTTTTGSPEPQADEPVSSPSTTLAMTDENEAAFRPPSESSLTQSTDDAEEQSAPAATPARQFVQDHSSRILAAFAVSLENILPPAIAEIILSPLLILDMVIRVLVESGRAIAMPFVLLLVYVLWGEILRPLRFVAGPTVSIRRKQHRPRELVRPAFALSGPPWAERPVRDRPPGRPIVIEVTRHPEQPPRTASVPRSPHAPPWGWPADHPRRSPRGATVGPTAHRPTPAPPT